jgi:hypothetical protein
MSCNTKVSNPIQAVNAAEAAYVDFIYRQDMIDAAGQDMVLRLTRACLVDAQAQLARIKPVEGMTSVVLSAEEVRASHRLAGSCAAVGLVGMGRAWYALEQAAASGPGGVLGGYAELEVASLTLRETAKALGFPLSEPM